MLESSKVSLAVVKLGYNHAGGKRSTTFCNASEVFPVCSDKISPTSYRQLISLTRSHKRNSEVEEGRGGACQCACPGVRMIDD